MYREERLISEAHIIRAKLIYVICHSYAKSAKHQDTKYLVETRAYIKVSL